MWSRLQLGLRIGRQHHQEYFFPGKTSLLAERISSREDRYLKYTFPPPFSASLSQSLGGISYDLSLKDGLFEENGLGGEGGAGGSINVNVKDTAHSVFEIVGVKRAQPRFI